ncbi:MAG: hypothetical protein M3R14_07490 [Acidobacteriota bacterium]|nr:hypothetical protein [Acidobacteriota bacterium]
MKAINIINFKLRSLATALLLSFALALFGNATQVLAHGGEDHGDEKPKTATTTAGTISRTARLSDFEIMLKHSPLEPDAAATGRLFITRFATNEPVGDANPAIEIESATGLVTEIPVEKTDAIGSYVARIPALPEGTYTVRTKAVAASGKTNTATFSGVEIAHQEAAAETGSSWTQTALMVILFLVALALFGGLAYFALRVFKNKPLGEETVSA